MTDLPLTPILIAATIAVLWLGLTFRGQIKRRQVVDALAKGAKVIDVRSPSEFGSGHFEGALNIPHDKIASKLKSIGPTDATYVLYCASGARSAVATQTLRSNGYQSVINAGRLASMPS